MNDDNRILQRLPCTISILSNHRRPTYHSSLHYWKVNKYVFDTLELYTNRCFREKKKRHGCLYSFLKRVLAGSFPLLMRRHKSQTCLFFISTNQETDVICQDQDTEKLHTSMSVLSLTAEIDLPLLRPYQSKRVDVGCMNKIPC